jgi:hypothetical protein
MYRGWMTGKAEVGYLSIIRPLILTFSGGGTSATLRILGLTSDQAVTGNFEGHGVI